MLGLETSLCSFGPTDAHPEQIKTVTNKILLMAGVKGITQPVSHSHAVNADFFAIRFICSILCFQLSAIALRRGRIVQCYGLAPLRMNHPAPTQSWMPG